MSVAIDKNNDSDEGMLVREASQHPTNSDTRPDNATLEAVDQVPVVHNHKAAPGVEGGNAASAPFSAIDIPGNHSILNDPPIPKHDTVAPEEDELKGRQRTVRFYSRVRITSGVGYSRRSRSAHGEHIPRTGDDNDEERIRSSSAVDIARPADDSPYRSNDTSTSASYSSSISAPLRSSSELPPRPPNHRKPLSNLLDSSDANSWLQSLAVERRKKQKRRRHTDVDERSPLLQPPGILRHDPHGEHLSSGDHIRRKRTLDGSRKYFTLYYWESQLSAMCCCADEQDEYL